MGAGARRLLAVVGMGAALGTVGCGDPIVVVGDLPGTMRLVAGIPGESGVLLDTLATESRLTRPEGLAADTDGRLFIADGGSGRILSVASDGRIAVLLDRRECPIAVCPQRPQTLALDGSGGLYFADAAANRVWRMRLDGTAVEVVAGTGDQASSPDGALASEAPLAAPQGLAVGPDGTLYVAERAGRRVRTITRDGILGTAAGTGESGTSGDDGLAIEATFVTPAGLALHGGILFIADPGASSVRAVNLVQGRISRVAGSGIPAFGGDGGSAIAAQLRFPEDVAVSRDGRSLFIADTGNNRIRRVNLSAGSISTFVGTGGTGLPTPEQPAGETPLDTPRGVTTSPFGFLYVSTLGHHVVWRVSLEV